MRRLGESPLSLVFLVEDDQKKQYALKVLRPSVAKDKRILERWRREGELLQEFSHPNLVHCYGSPEVEGRPSILLEFVDGLSLRERLRTGPLGWEQAARYGVQIARALQYLHKHGAIHRDVKPHNVLIDTQKGAILADLGLVRREEDPTMTRQGAALGSPAYMSPEQARDPSQVDEQADIYSLGATMFHTLSGKPPFLGAGVGEVIHRVLHEEPEELPETVPPAFAKVVMTAMAKDPERRYARARDFGSDMGRVLLGYAPRLLTRYRRRRQLRTLSMMGCAVGLLGLMFWLKPWNFGSEQELANSNLMVEEVGPPILPPPLLVDEELSTATHSQPEILLATYFRAWHTPYDQRFRKALNTSQYREALAECAGILNARVPKDAPLGFLDLRQGWVNRSQTEVTAAAEKAAGRAFDLLSSQTVFAREAIMRGDFDGDKWSASVLDQWRRAGLRMADLPLHPGSPDPVGRLQMTQVQLENDAEQTRIRKVLQSVDAVCQNTAQLLRAGSFEEARRRWDRVDPVVFLHSEQARADLARIEELLALDRRLQSRFREKVGQNVELRLHSGVPMQGQLIAKASGNGYAVDYRGQTQVDVDLLGLESEFAVTWVLGREEAWLTAQVHWCQDDLNLAIASMRPIADQDVAAEWRPQYWLGQWELERKNGGLAEIGFSEEGSANVGAQNVPSPRGPQRELMDALQKRLPSAKLSQNGLVVALDLGELIVDGAWNLDLRQELRGWELSSWRLVWQVDPYETAPARLLWLDNILLSKTGKAPPQMTVAGRRFPGYGIAPGLGIQVLDWDGQNLLLDGIPVSPWQPESARLARFLAVCESGFRFDKVSLHFSPR